MNVFLSFYIGKDIIFRCETDRFTEIRTVPIRYLKGRTMPSLSLCYLIEFCACRDVIIDLKQM